MDPLWLARWLLTAAVLIGRQSCVTQASPSPSCPWACTLSATFANGKQLTATLLSPSTLQWTPGGISWTRHSTGTGTPGNASSCLGDWFDSGNNPVLITPTTITGPGGPWYPADVTQYDAGQTLPPPKPPAPAPAGRQRPCDIYRAAGTPCVAAHSVTRALFGSYGGPLYAVTRKSDNRSKDVAVLAAGGVANAAVQEAFCTNADCIISTIYDQSGRRNHLSTAPPGGNHHVHDVGVNASKLRVRVGGADVFGAYFEGDHAGTGMGYRNDCTSGVATADQPETMYMVTGGKHFNAGCCFDYGNAETNNDDDGAGTMECVYFGTWNATRSGWCGGSGAGPWVMADLENGLWACDKPRTVYQKNIPATASFVMAMVKGDTANHWSIKAGNAQDGRLSTMFDGERPPGYHPMRKQGGIILGIGGDNSEGAVGTFFEGAMTAGFSGQAADDAVQAEIVSAGYQHLGDGLRG